MSADESGAQIPISASAGTQSVRTAALGPLLARLVSLVVSTVGSVIYSKLLLGSIGVEAFGSSALVVAAMWILPVLVDGSRTVIVNCVSRVLGERGALTEDSRFLLWRAARHQVAAGVMSLVASLIAAAAVWLFTRDSPLALLTAAVGAMLAVSAFASPGAAVFQGRGLQSVLSLLPIATTAASLAILYALMGLGLGVIAAVAAPAAGAATAMAAYMWAIRVWGLPLHTFRDLARRPSGHTANDSVGAVAKLATSYSLASTLFFVIDRYLISGSSALFLAAFILVQQVSTPLVALTVTVGDGLWAHVEAERGAGLDDKRRRLLVVRVSAAIGSALSLLFVLVAPYYVRYMLGEEPDGTPAIVAALAILILSSGVRNGATSLLRNDWGLKVLNRVWWIALLTKVGGATIAMMQLGPISAIAFATGVQVVATGATLWAALRAPTRLQTSETANGETRIIAPEAGIDG